MKTLSFICLALLFHSCATLVQTTADPRSEVIEAKGTKDELFVKANQWSVRNFRDSKSVIQFQDKESGKIFGKYLLHPAYGLHSMYGYIEQSPDAYALITILIKDNAAKISIEPQGSWKSVKSGKEAGFDLQHSFTKERAELSIELLVNSFKKYLNSNVDEWN